ncbi:MAG TPA: TRASH domain-containing protein [Roseimicrobium sp.]|nr:TRASH domain-containing protein [Roseimicrobium sp.]
MKLLKNLSLGLVASALTYFAASAVGAEAAKAKPYTLKICAVSDEALGGMGDPYVFTYQGREIKLCCKSCEKDFKKEPAKFIKKIEAAEKKAAK